MADTGYGVHTKNLVRRLKEDHEVAVHSVGGWEGMGIDWEGVQIYPSGAGKHGENSIPYWFDKVNADVVFSHHDHWAMSDTLKNIQLNGIPMILYTVLDHDLPGQRPPPAVIEANENASHTIVMSKWAEERIRNSRIDQDRVRQIPHGVNTSKYAPVIKEISEERLKKDLGIPEDGFLFGMVAANYGPRKNIPIHMQAFKHLRDTYGIDDVYLYIHTHPTMGGGYNLYEVRDALNLSQEHCMFPDPHEMYHGLEDMVVVQLYNTFDVHLNVTQSESWGLTITEAMSCGTPVIAANNSAQTEQFGIPPDSYIGTQDAFKVTSQGLLVYRGAEMWTQNATARRFTARVDDIVDAMYFYYMNQELIDEHGENAREYVQSNYDWEYVYDEYWRPFFDEVEDEFTGDYNEWYFKRRERETDSIAFKQEALEISLEIRGDTVLDVGCGTGTLLKHLEEKGFDVTGIEKSEEGIELAEEKGLEVYQGDVRDINMKDNSYDTVVSQHVLEHVDADVYTLSEMCRVARKKVVAIVPISTAVSRDADPTEKHEYTAARIEKLAEDFEERTSYEMEYRKIDVTDVSQNWMITIEV